MKKITTVLLVSLIFSVSILQSGCFGQFEMVKTVYNWNDDISQNKFVKSLVFWVLAIIPVYEIAGIADIFILNVIEFWSGSNPMSMNEGDEEMQLVKYRGNDYKITATLNQLTVEQLSGKKKGAVASLVFDPQTDVWAIESNDQKIKIAKMMRNKHNKAVAINLFKPNNETVFIPYSEDGLAMINEMISENSELALNE